MRQKIARWWEGEWKRAEPPFVGVRRQRHWTSRGANASVKWTARNGWQLVGSLIAVAGVWIAYLSLK
jgi:hypothetical protein